MGLAVVVGIVAGQVQGVHTQEWVHAWGLFARNSLIDVVFPYLFKSPDVHSHGVALAVVEEVEGEYVAEWVQSYMEWVLVNIFHHNCFWHAVGSLFDGYFLKRANRKKLKQIEQT